MKSTKSWFVMMLFFVGTAFSFQSCSQYPENEGFTFLSKTDRLSKTWKVESYKVNDADYTSLMSNYTETFTKQGAFSYQWGIVGGNGTWVFLNKDAEIKITGINNQSTKVLYILKLEEDRFWYYTLDDDVKSEVHLIR